MQIKMHGEGIFEFYLNTYDDQKFVCCADNYEKAKELLLDAIAKNIDKELQKIIQTN